MGKARAKSQHKVKRVMSTSDPRIKARRKEQETKLQKELQRKRKMCPNELEVKQIPKEPTHLFFKYNTALGPPYRIIIDTNFINFSIQNKLDIFSSMMDCLLGKCIPIFTDCVIGELQKFGVKYRLALRLSKDPRFQRLICTHKGTYADDCIVQRVSQDRCFIVATCDKDLKRRLRKIPGVPIMYISGHKYTIERMPDAYGAPR